MSTHTTNAIVATSKLIALGDAIRAKVGLPDEMTLDEMAAAIANISTGSPIDYVNSDVTELPAYIYYEMPNVFNSVSFPNVTTIGKRALGLNMSGVSSLKSVSFPSATYIGEQAFICCDNVEIYDFPQAVTIERHVFRRRYNTAKTKALVLRSTTMSTCTASTSLSYSNFADQSKEAYVYVPAALVASYTAAQGFEVARIRALEDYTVDGTLTGDLDPTKI